MRKSERAGHPECDILGKVLLSWEFSLGNLECKGKQATGSHLSPCAAQQEQQGLPRAGSCCPMAWGQFAVPGATTSAPLKPSAARPAAGSARSLPNPRL